MIAMKDLLAVTGYIRGGCSPVGMKKRFPTYFHSTAMEFERIYVSAGVRGLQLQIAPSELIAFVGGIVADVASID
jgi:Cys-tRNA(Pro)/Cys-tRNA(Cys) deacylase